MVSRCLARPRARLEWQTIPVRRATHSLCCPSHSGDRPRAILNSTSCQIVLWAAANGNSKAADHMGAGRRVLGQRYGLWGAVMSGMYKPNL